jgi:hypothetical protein
MGKKSGFGSEKNNPSHISEFRNLVLGVKLFKFFDADPDGKNSDPEWKKFRIRDKHPGFATLLKILKFFYADPG